MKVAKAHNFSSQQLQKTVSRGLSQGVQGQQGGRRVQASEIGGRRKQSSAKWQGCG